MELWRELKIGDRVRLAQFPPEFQRPGYHLHFDTRALYEHLAATAATLVVTRIDSYGMPWAEYAGAIEGVEDEWHEILLNHDGLERVAG